MPKVKFYKDSAKLNQVYPDIDLGENLEINLANYFALTADDGIYGISWSKWDTSHSSSCTKYGKNASQTIVPSTNTSVGSSTYSEAFDTYDCNAFVDDDGVQHITYLKGMTGYGDTEDTIQTYTYKGKTYLQDVFVLKRTYYEKWYVDGDTQHYERTFVPKEGFTVVSQAVAKDGTIKPWFLVAKYEAGLDSQNRRRSLKNLVPIRNCSYNNIVSGFNARGTYYTGALMSEYKDIITTFWLKYGTRNTQSVMAGCSNYNYRYNVLSDSLSVSRVKILTSQANNLIVGSSVSVGDAGANTYLERGQAYMHNIVDSARIISITQADSTHSYVNLDCAPFTISNPSTTYVMTMPWITGFSDMVLGRDGAPGNLTDHKTPMVIDGIEIMSGLFEIPGNAVMNILNEDGVRETYITNDATKISTDFEDIQADYEKSTYNVTPGRLNVVKTIGSNVYIPGDTTSLNRYEVRGDSIQETTTGKNLLNIYRQYESGYTYTDNGITYTINSDNQITINGTASAGSRFDFIFRQTNYAISGGGNKMVIIKTAGTISSEYIRFGVYKTDWTGALGIDVDSSTSVNSRDLVSGDDYEIFRISCPEGGVYNNVKIQLMIEAQSEDNTYEKYTGGVAAPSPNYPQPIINVNGGQDLSVYKKNLLDSSNISDVNLNGITPVYNSDGSITVTGNPYQIWSNILLQQDIKLPNGYYTLSIDKTLDFYIGLRVYNTSGTYTDYRLNNGNTSITLELNNTTSIRAYIIGMTVGTPINETFKLQLEKGEGATTFAKFSKNAYPINLGKNLLNLPDFDDTINGCHITIQDGVMTIKGTPSATITKYWELPTSITTESGRVYTLSVKKVVNGSSSSNAAAYRLLVTNAATNINSFGKDWRTINNTWIQSITNDHAATSRTYTYFFMQLNENENFDCTLYYQLEEGDSVSDFVPYTSNILELNKIGGYQDKIYKQNDKWYLEKNVGKYTFTGDETITKQAEGFLISEGNWNEYTNNNCLNKSILYSNYYTNYTSYGSLVGQDYGIGIIYNNLNNLYIRNTTISNVEDFEDWLRTHNTYVYYQLKIPVITEITDINLISQLNALTLTAGESTVNTDTTNGQTAILAIYTNDNFWNYITEAQLDLTNGAVIPTQSGQTGSSSTTGYADGLSANDGIGEQREIVLLGYLMHSYYSGLTMLDNTRAPNFAFWGFTSRLSINAVGESSPSE